MEPTDQRGTSVQDEPRRFPLLDEELPPRPWWRHLLTPAAVLLIAAVVAVAATLAVSGDHGGARPTPARDIAIPGHIVSLNNDDDLLISSTGGLHVQSPSALTQVGQQVTPTLDGKFVSLGDGQIVSTSGGRIALAHTALVPLANGDQGAFGSEPLAGHDTELIAMATNTEGGYNRNDLYELSLKTGKRHYLGLADQASGDPQTAGAFVTVGANATKLVEQNAPILPDTMAELIIPGRRPVRYGTAAALGREVGLSSHDPGLHNKIGFVLGVYPSPSGDRVAITVAQADEGRYATGIVLLSRTGHLIARLPAAANPQGGIPAWSPDGRTLAFQGGKAVHAAVDLWAPGHPLRHLTTPFPGNTGVGFSVQWSPDSQRVLVASTLGLNANSAARHWAFGKVTGGPMTQVNGPGTPVVWLP